MAENNRQTKEARREYDRGNPKNENILEQLFPQGSRILNGFNGKLSIVFIAIAIIMVLSFLFSFFWGATWMTIAKIALIAAVAIGVYRVFLNGWGIWAWACESLGRAIGFTLTLVALALICFKLGWTTAGIVVLLLATVFATIYCVRNKDALIDMYEHNKPRSRGRNSGSKRKRHTPHP